MKYKFHVIFKGLLFLLLYVVACLLSVPIIKGEDWIGVYKHVKLTTKYEFVVNGDYAGIRDVNNYEETFFNFEPIDSIQIYKNLVYGTFGNSTFILDKSTDSIYCVKVLPKYLKEKSMKRPIPFYESQTVFINVIIYILWAVLFVVFYIFKKKRINSKTA